MNGAQQIGRIVIGDEFEEVGKSGSCKDIEYYSRCNEEPLKASKQKSDIIS